MSDTEGNLPDELCPEEESRLAAIAEMYARRNVERMTDEMVKYFEFLQRWSGVSIRVVDLGVPAMLVQVVREVHELPMDAIQAAVSCLSMLVCFNEKLTEYMLDSGVVDALVSVCDCGVPEMTIAAVSGLAKLADFAVHRVIGNAKPLLRRKLFRTAQKTDAGYARDLGLQLAKLFSHFAAVDLQRVDIERAIWFFIELIRSDNEALMVVGMQGIYDFSVRQKIDSKMFGLFQKKMPDVIEAALGFTDVSHIAVACSFLREMLRIEMKEIDFDQESIYLICRDHCNDEAGLAAYHLLESISSNCEGDTFQMLCMTGLAQLSQGVIFGAFQIKESSIRALMNIIKGTESDFVHYFVDDGVMSALLLASEIPEYTARIIKRLNILFERCRICSLHRAFTDVFTRCQGNEALVALIEEAEDAKVVKRAIELVDRLASVSH